MSLTVVAQCRIVGGDDAVVEHPDVDESKRLAKPPSQQFIGVAWLSDTTGNGSQGDGERGRGIDRTLVDHVSREKIAEGCSNATVNRTLELLRAVLRKCVNEWEWLDRAPYVRMLKEPTRRIRFLTQDEARGLRAQLPAHLADMATFSLATGLRAANVTGLEWLQVDEESKLCWVHSDQAKARRAIAVPLNGEALSIVQKQRGIHATHVFSFRGKPMTQVSGKAWYGALKRAGIQNFRWHDLRIRGRAGMCKTARPSSSCRNWGVGNRSRWRAVMRISRRITWRPLRIA